MDRESVQAYYNRICNANIKLRLNYYFGNVGIALIMSFIFVGGLIGAIFAGAFSSNIVNITLMGKPLPMFAIMFSGIFLVLFFFWIVIISRRKKICDISFARFNGLLYVCWSYKHKKLYMTENGIVVSIKYGKPKLKFEKEFIPPIFCILPHNVENIAVKDSGLKKRIKFNIGHVTGADEAVPTVRLCVCAGNIRSLSEGGKLYEYDNINSESFVMDFPAIAKPTFEMLNVTIPPFVVFKETQNV